MNTTIISCVSVAQRLYFGHRVCDIPGHSDGELKGVMNIRLYQYLISNPCAKNN